MGNSWDNKATSPQFTTSVITDSSTFSVFNTNATTINAFGAATTTLNLGSQLTITSSSTTSTVLTPNSNTAIAFVSNGTYTADTTGTGSGSQSFLSSIPTFSPTNSLNNASAIVIKPDVNAASGKLISYARAALFRMNANVVGYGVGTIDSARTVEISGPARGAGTVNTGYGLYVSKGSGCTVNKSAYLEDLEVGTSLTVNGVTIYSSERGTVTQTTSITTAVTINYLQGTITTVSHSYSANTGEIFNVNNSEVDSTDVIECTTQHYGGSINFTAQAFEVQNGSFSIRILALGSTTAAIAVNFKVSKTA